MNDSPSTDLPMFILIIGDFVLGNRKGPLQLDETQFEQLQFTSKRRANVLRFGLDSFPRRNPRRGRS